MEVTKHKDVAISPEMQAFERWTAKLADGGEFEVWRNGDKKGAIWHLVGPREVSVTEAQELARRAGRAAARVTAQKVFDCDGGQKRTVMCSSW